jgi:hypothetical protein
MVFHRIIDAFSGEPQLPPEPIHLPSYFPVEPKGCETQAQKLFACLANEATKKARDMEKAGLQSSYFPDVKLQPEDDRAAQLVAAAAKDGNDPSLPKAGDNPLEECRSSIAYYKRCCDRALKKRQNWILTEPYRVQEEYRYKEDGSK